MENNKLSEFEKYSSSQVSPLAYKSTPWWYDLRGFFILTFSYRDSLWSQINFFNKNIGKIHLEGAIGTGTLSNYILKVRKILFYSQNFTFYGVDYSPEMLNGAKKKLVGKNIVIELGDLTNLRFENNFFDSINVANSFHTIKEIKNALCELHRVLKNDGTIAMNVLLYPGNYSWLDRLSQRINRWGQKKGILFRPYEEKEVVKMLNDTNFLILCHRKKGNALYLICKKNH